MWLSERAPWLQRISPDRGFMQAIRPATFGPFKRCRMLFNSLEFAVFFPVVTILFFLLTHRFRWMLLLAASCFFYMFFKPVYILILVFTIVIDYFAGIWI